MLTAGAPTSGERRLTILVVFRTFVRVAPRSDLGFRLAASVRPAA
jgi:hypothetical protein